MKAARRRAGAAAEALEVGAKGAMKEEDSWAGVSLVRKMVVVEGRARVGAAAEDEAGHG